MLSARELLEYKKKNIPAVLSLGLKESNPDNSEFDTLQLEAKLKNVAELLSLERVRTKGQLSKAAWRPERGEAEVLEQVGNVWTHLGHTINQKTYLYPEEALYLVDIGALELTYNDVSLSLQRAYFLLTHAVTLEKYRVFSQLSLLGYKVIRHSSKNVLTKYEKDIEVHKIRVKHKDVTEPTQPTTENKEVDEVKAMDLDSCGKFPIEYDSNVKKRTIMERLQNIGPKRDPCVSSAPPVVDYDVFQAGNDVGFRKSTVQLPSFRIRVFSSTEDPPDLVDLCRTGNYFQDQVPFITAVVYPDFINFLQISTIDIPTLE